LSKVFDIATQIFGDRNYFDNVITFNGHHIGLPIMNHFGALVEKKSFVIKF
jgi:hypothetical protein